MQNRSNTSRGARRRPLPIFLCIGAPVASMMPRSYSPYPNVAVPHTAAKIIPLRFPVRSKRVEAVDNSTFAAPQTPTPPTSENAHDDAKVRRLAGFASAKSFPMMASPTCRCTCAAW
jgi:hypothetical protein